MLWKIMGRLYVNNKRLAKCEKRQKETEKSEAKRKKRVPKTEVKPTKPEDDDWFDRTKRHGTTAREIQLDVTDIDDISRRYTV